MKPKLTAIILISAIIISGVVVISALTGRNNKPVSKSVEHKHVRPVAKRPFQPVKPPKITYKSDIAKKAVEPNDPNANSGLSKAKMDKRRKIFSSHTAAKQGTSSEELSASPYDLYIPAPVYVPLFEQRQQLTMSQEFQRHTKRYQILKDSQRFQPTNTQQTQMKKEMFSRVSSRYQGYFNNIEQMKKDKLANMKQPPLRPVSSNTGINKNEIKVTPK